MRTQETIGDIVAADYRTAAVFDRFGVDFCCGGKRTLAEACRQANLDETLVRSELESLPAGGAADLEPTPDWTVEALVDEIVSRHHAYIRTMVPVLLAHTQKIANVYGARKPELRTVARHFMQVASDLQQHMVKEERILFPQILSLSAMARLGGRPVEESPFGTLQNPIRRLEEEHQDAGYEMWLIRELTQGYVPPDFACTTYRACLAELQEFEADLHRHVHLENNILFPAATRLEQALS
jgi:regulator of cell morphogenesis and NO signaling